MCVCLRAVGNERAGDCFSPQWSFAPDIVLLAPSANAMRRMLLCFDSYASDYNNIIFNASKSKCIHFSPKGHNKKLLGGIPIFSVCSQPIKMVKQWSHLGHIISHDFIDMDDRYDIMRCHDSLVRQTNNVLCFLAS